MPKISEDVPTNSIGSSGDGEGSAGPIQGKAFKLFKGKLTLRDRLKHVNDEHSDTIRGASPNPLENTMGNGNTAVRNKVHVLRKEFDKHREKVLAKSVNKPKKLKQIIDQGG